MSSHSICLHACKICVVFVEKKPKSNSCKLRKILSPPHLMSHSCFYFHQSRRYLKLRGGGGALIPLTPLIELESKFHVAHWFLIKFYTSIQTLFLCIFHSLSSYRCTDTYRDRRWALLYKHICVYVCMFIFSLVCTYLFTLS